MCVCVCVFFPLAAGVKSDQHSVVYPHGLNKMSDCYYYCYYLTLLRVAERHVHNVTCDGKIFLVQKAQVSPLLTRVPPRRLRGPVTESLFSAFHDAANTHVGTARQGKQRVRSQKLSSVWLCRIGFCSVRDWRELSPKWPCPKYLPCPKVN